MITAKGVGYMVSGRKSKNPSFGGKSWRKCEICGTKIWGGSNTKYCLDHKFGKR